MYTIVLTLHAALWLGLFVTSCLYAAAGNLSVCPMIFFTNATSYNVAVAQRVDATTYLNREEVSKKEPFVWQVAPAGSCIPLGRLNKDQFMIDLKYKFYGIYYGSDEEVPILFNITQKGVSRKNLYNVGLSQTGVLRYSYTIKLTYGISLATRLQDIFARAQRCLPHGVSGKFYSIEELGTIGTTFAEKAKDPKYAYLFLNLPKIEMDNKASTAATLLVVKHLWSEAMESDMWFKGNDKVVALRSGSSLDYYDLLSMHAQTILFQAYRAVEEQCKHEG